MSAPSLLAKGLVASLHLHPHDADHALSHASSIELVEARGIRGEPRYFGRRNSKGEPSRRQVTVIERERIAEHAIALGIPCFEPGIVRSNIETTGINLVALLGRHVRIGDAILHFYEPRTPCAKMDALAPGLRALMENGRQGVLAEVVRSGTVRVGDSVEVLNSSEFSTGAP